MRAVRACMYIILQLKVQRLIAYETILATKFIWDPVSILTLLFSRSRIHHIANGNLELG